MPPTLTVADLRNFLWEQDGTLPVYLGSTPLTAAMIAVRDSVPQSKHFPFGLPERVGIDVP